MLNQMTKVILFFYAAYILSLIGCAYGGGAVELVDEICEQNTHQ